MNYLSQAFRQMQGDLEILHHVLTKRYFREALNLVLDMTMHDAVQIDLHDLDIVCMQSGGVDEDDVAQALSNSEISRLAFIESIDFKEKSSYARHFCALGYKVQVHQCEDPFEDNPMTVTWPGVSATHRFFVSF